MHFTAQSAEHALSQGLEVLQRFGAPRASRNGPVLAMDEPVVVSYVHPDRRVVFAPERDANPFFHLFEFLWMMQGRRDVRGVAEFVPGMRNYSDDGRQFNAAYGHRWRRHFKVDQVELAVEALRAEGGAEDRRVFVQMWDARVDNRQTLDKPCNVGAAFRVRSDGRLDMTVFNRSNDLVLGLAGANVVHMSMLHELVASCSGRPLGTYHQATNDLHMYVENPATIASLPLAGSWSEDRDPYVQGLVASHPVAEVGWRTWVEDLETFQRYGNVVGLRDRFFRRVCGPMMLAHRHYRENEGAERYEGAIEILEQCLASDWATAGREWMQRRLDRWTEKA